jgi:K+-sensing histidine kinase KdpD
MEDLSLHILDVTENSVRACASEIALDVHEDVAAHRLTIRIRDNGEGMTEEALRRACDPFFSTKGGKRVGLGLPLLRQSAEETGGTMEVRSSPNAGTEVEAVFRTDHPDMRPMGDLMETLATLVTANPSIRVVADVDTGECRFHFDSMGKSQEEV